MSARLRLKLLGDFSLTAGALPVMGVNSERLHSLLAFIAIHRATPQSRQQIAVNLWAEVSETDAKANLRRRLHELKQLIPALEHCLRIETKTVQWISGSNCWLDVEEFEAAIAQSQQTPEVAIQALERAAQLYQGDLLPTCYDDWIVPHREQLQQQAIASLEKLITLLSSDSNVRSAIRYAQQLQRLDPLYEPAYCHLMRLHAQEGDRASALRVYHQCMTTLQAELGVNPSPTTCKLYEELLTQEESSPPTCVAQEETATPVGSDSLLMPPPVRQTFTATLPLIGRVTEWEVIQQWRSHCLEQQRSNLLLLLGEAGIGKTRLLEELAQTIHQDSGYVLWGRGFEAEMLRPYGIWIDSFQSIGATTVLDELRTLVLNAESAATLNRGRLFDRATQFLTQLAETAPVLVVLDDIQWLDEASIAFLHYALRLLSPPLPIWFACAARKQELETNRSVDRLLQALYREYRICKIEITPLDRTQILSLAQTVGWTQDGDRLFTSSGGNPLFALEIARAQPSTRDTTPDTLETLIQGRLRQLEATPRELIPWAAALGRSFNPSILATVADCPLPRLLNAIEQLEQHGIIRPGVTVNGEVSYDFAHDVVREVAYAQISEPRRRLLHTHIAQALNTIATPTSPLMNDVAHHADLGSDPALAAHACLKAAERCLQIFAYAEASELSQRGLRHCQSLEPVSRIHYQLALLKAVVKAGVSKEQVASLRQDLETLTQQAVALGQPDDESTGLEALISLNYDHGNLTEVQQYSLRAAERGRIASPAMMMRMLAHSGSCLAEIGREMARAEALLLEAQSMSDRLGLPSIDLLFGLGCVRRYQGRGDEARSLLYQGWQMAQVAQDHWRECTCLTNLVMLELETGNPTQALNDGMELIRVSAQMGGGSEATHAAALDAVTHYLLQKSHAPKALEQACQMLQTIDSPRMFAFVQTIAAQWDLQQGNGDQAVSRAEVALEAAQSVGNPSEIVLAWSVIIQVGYQRKNFSCAQQHFADLKTRFGDRPLSAVAQQRLSELEEMLKGLRTKG